MVCGVIAEGDQRGKARGVRSRGVAIAERK